MSHPSLAPYPLEDCLQLIRSEHVGPITYFSLINRFGSPAAALRRLPELAQKGGMKRAFQLAPREAVLQEIEATEAFGARFIRYGEAEYPELLQQIHAPPPLLIIRGHAHLWSAARRCIGMVGSRNASAAGCNFTTRLATECAEHGLSVVSGLARGIDTHAHRGALAGGTMGVIAGGIDTLYPPENKSLYAAMAESGAIVTEHAIGTTPQSRNFPARNRIIAGICAALVVIEAAPRSGSLITARFALEEGRELLAVPGSPMDPRSGGTNKLIKEGAHLCESVEDILAALEQPLPSLHEPATTSNLFASLAEAPAEPDEDETSDAREQLLSLLSPIPTNLDDITEQSALPIPLLQQCLLELELAGRLSHSSGGKVALVA